MQGSELGVRYKSIRIQGRAGVISDRRSNWNHWHHGTIGAKTVSLASDI